MKILLINALGQDYLTVTVYHGLVSLGHDVTELNYMDFMRKSNKDKIQRETLYGNGYSYAFTIDDNELTKQKDISNIENQIAEHYFDIVIYGNIWACQDYFDLVCTKYSLGEIFILDGCDWANMSSVLYHIHTPKLLYFKRELYFGESYFGRYINTFPISFGIPKEKFTLLDSPIKKSEILVNDCGYENIHTHFVYRNYNYNTEEEYYKHYTETFLAMTCKKADWDCMRHYEIIASGALPVFIDYDKKPANVMTMWPTILQHQANVLYYNYLQDPNIFNNEKIQNYYLNILYTFYNYYKVTQILCK